MVASWCDGFFATCHMEFVKGGLLWKCHRLQWCGYMEEFWPSTIDNPGCCMLANGFVVWIHYLSLVFGHREWTGCKGTVHILHMSVL